MIELKIVRLDDREYFLEDENSNQYKFQIKFFDLEKPVVGDSLVFNEKLLNRGYKEYSNKLMFGALDKPYGRKIESRDHPDLLCVKKGGKEYWLKRFWG